MDDNVIAFVENDEVFIFVQDFEGDVFRRDLRTSGRGQHRPDDIAQAQFRGGLRFAPVHRYRLLPDQSLQAGATDERYTIHEISIQPLIEIAGEGELDADR